MDGSGENSPGESRLLSVVITAVIVLICFSAIVLILLIPPKSIDIGSVYQKF